MTVVGLTGILGAGKTTVADMFAECGAEVVSADRIAHDLLDSPGSVSRTVKKVFPEAVLKSGRIDKKILSEIVFNNRRALTQLEKIIHPEVECEIKKRLKKFKKDAVVVLDVPLLFEANMHKLCDHGVVVKSNQALAISRFLARTGKTRKDFLIRFKYQMPQTEKLRRADFIIDNRFSRAKTRSQVRRVWKMLVRP